MTRICPRCGFATMRPGPKARECGRILCGYKERDQPIAGDARPPSPPEGNDAPITMRELAEATLDVLNDCRDYMMTNEGPGYPIDLERACEAVVAAPQAVTASPPSTAAAVSAPEGLDAERLARIRAAAANPGPVTLAVPLLTIENARAMLVVADAMEGELRRQIADLQGTVRELRSKIAVAPQPPPEGNYALCAAVIAAARAARALDRVVDEWCEHGGDGPDWNAHRECARALHEAVDALELQVQEPRA